MAMDTQTPPFESEEISPNSELAQQVAEETGVNPMECYQCGKCSSGCPIVELTDVMPHDFWRMVQLGMEDQLFQSHHLWLCVSCETCTTRCPNQLALPKVIDFLRQRATASGVTPSEPSIPAFHKAFMDTVERHGRLHELSMIRKYKMATGDFFKDFKLGLKLFGKGKIHLFAKNVSSRDEIRKLFKENIG